MYNVIALFLACFVYLYTRTHIEEININFIDILEEENANEWPPKSLILLSMASLANTYLRDLLY